MRILAGIRQAKAHLFEGHGYAGPVVLTGGPQWPGDGPTHSTSGVQAAVRFLKNQLEVGAQCAQIGSREQSKIVSLEQNSSFIEAP